MYLGLCMETAFSSKHYNWGTALEGLCIDNSIDVKRKIRIYSLYSTSIHIFIGIILITSK